MEFDNDSLFNFIPIISTTVCALVFCITIYSGLKIRWPVKVNCWFCNCNTKVHRGEFDWWFCPKCEQYNGFTKDGNYKYSIPEQYQTPTKNVIRYGSTSDKMQLRKNDNGLCNKCNKNEELKLQELRKFENTINIDNKKEFELFEQRINNKFPLCENCENTVLNILKKQSLWLAQYKMSFFRHKPIITMIKNGRKFANILRILLVIIACTAVCYSETWYFPICGFLLQLVAYLASPTEAKNSNILPLLGWICFSGLSVFHSTVFYTQLLNFSPENDWVSFAYYQCIVVLASYVMLSNVTRKPHKTVCNSDLSFKKLQLPKWSAPYSRSPSPTFANEPMKETSFVEDYPRNLYSPVNITNTLMAPDAIETPIPEKPIDFLEMSLEKQKSLPFNQSFTNLSFTTTLDNSFSNVPNKGACFSLNESLSSLSSLSLDSIQSSVKPSPTIPKVFETRTYGTPNSDLFMKYSRAPSRKSILAPPKLTSVAQSSWVAGGYWQVGIEAPTLSRSSSQSSGIGSIGSHFSPSREPSFYELDRCSVMSKSIQCHFTRPESCASLKTSVIRNSILPQQQVQSNLINKTSYEESSQNPVINGPEFSHHVTVVTTPSWLSAVLCGSLVVNIIVLCTILLR